MTIKNKIINKIIQYARPKIVIFLLVQIVLSFLTIYLVDIQKKYINECIAHIQMSSLIIFGLFIVCLSGVVFIIRYYIETFKNIFLQKIEMYFRNTIMHQIIMMKLKSFESYLTHELRTMLSHDIRNITGRFLNFCLSRSTDIYFFVIAFIYLIFSQGFMTLIIIIELAVMWFLLKYIHHNISTLFEKDRFIIGQINTFVGDTIEGIYDLKLFNKNNERYRGFVELNKQYTENFKRICFWTNFPIHEFFYMALFASAILIVCIKMTVTNQNVYGEFIVLTIVMGYLINPITSLYSGFSNIQEASKSYAKINELIEKEKEIFHKKESETLLKINTLEFKNVYFSYDNIKYALEDISLSIHKGEKIGIVGINGSGKSTLITLLNRMHEPEKGDICINGKNITSYSIEDIRKNVNIISQESNLILDDPVDNIVFDDLYLREKKIFDLLHESGVALKHIHQTEKPKTDISKSQKHLISIMRGLIRNYDLYVFDEITSDLDSKTELHLKTFIEQRFKEKTCIFITHQIHSLPEVQKIIVIHNGKIQEMGTPQELFERGGIYYTLYNIQYLESLYSKILQLVNKLALKDGYTRYHYLKSALLARRVCEKLDLSKDIIEVIELAAYLSDIGKLNIPDEILKKTGKLTDEEKQIVQNHVIYGNKITKELQETYAISQIIYHHHERWDGTGYPDGLKGENIPLGSCIITIIDAYRAMMTGRPYRSRLGREESVKRLKAGAGTHFDAHLVQIFLEVLNEEQEKELDNKRIIEGYERWYNQISKKSDSNLK